ncbi:MAG: oligopeptide/dipeptide ABC transporter ATP-binding protein [Halolamina sp.]|uniref:ABC transporter ATP-binding protein n=1 Tax=Halolamina sp. TaxID=1940283 RepID=UPI002FC35663
MFGRGTDISGLDESIDRGETLVSIDGLRKHYGGGGPFEDPLRAVDGVSIDVRKGETLGLVGESGCGKTTLGRTVVGLENATGGSVQSRGVEVTDLSAGGLRRWQQDAQIVFQDPEASLNDRMTVGEIVREPLDGHSWRTPEDRRERVFHLLDRVGLQREHYYRYPHQFSGGQRQRVGIARALTLRPEFLVLDEPVSALDVSVQARIINLLSDLQDELDLTYLFIAHDLSVVEHIADRVAVMYLGEIVEVGPTAQVFDSPSHPYTASLLSAVPTVRTGDEREAEHGRITLRGTPPNPRDPPPGCRFATRCPAKIRPDGFDISEAGWIAIGEFRTVLRERARSDDSVTETVARRIGLRTDESVETVRAELFDGVDLPQAIRAELHRATELAAEGRAAEASERLRQSFGSVCDSEAPSDESVGAERRSRCLRNQASYDDTAAVLDRRRDTR